MATVCLSKSKRAVLFYPGDGRVFVTSVSYFKMLLECRAKGNMLVLTDLTAASDAGIGVVDNVKSALDKRSSFSWDSLGDN